MKPLLILMSHGNLASALVESAKMILGSVDDCSVIEILQDYTFDSVENKLNDILENTNNDVLIFTDLYGGTPFNIASKFCRQNDKIHLITGMNLDMVIEYFSSNISDNCDKLIEDIINVSRDSIILYSKNDDNEYPDVEIK